ncbi:sulfatase-like hydrolase/transferase [Pontiellaceae bacterium B12227]|nr:sulfatase-like hydrolase/transferase [Pontiellaceae bacterium B12227]
MKTIITILLAATSLSALAANRPNILMIMCDDLGYADVGFSGSPDIRTPKMDSLAEAGTICTSGYVTHSFCGPSRMGLLSGRYPHTFGGQFNLPPVHAGIEEYNKLGIPENETLISTVLQDAGYFTGIIGKWHLGEDPQYHPNNRGFDDFYGFLGGGHNYFPEEYMKAYAAQKAAGKQHIYDYLIPLQHNGQPTVEDEYLTDEMSQHAVGFIKQAADKDQPFFLYLAYNAPHTPMEAKADDMATHAHIANEQRRTVAGMMVAVDRGVGMVADALKETGQFNNTLIIFLADNGGRADKGSSNQPLRGVKGDTFEGGFRVPMFWHWPGKIPAQKYDHPVSALDFYPTLAALAGAKIPADKELDGKDILKAIQAGADCRNGDMIYSLRHRNTFSDISARRGDWKVVRYANQPWRLFNITDDPGETKDLAAQNPERVTEMVKQAKAWSRTHTEPRWFHALPARDAWNNNNMPNFENDFQPTIGALKLPAVTYITDVPAAPAASTVSSSGAVAQPQRALKTGDQTLEMYIAKEKVKWEKNGWPWKQENVERNFAEVDVNRDGIASGKERNAWFDKKKKGISTALPAATPQTTAPAVSATGPVRQPQRELKKGDQSLEMYIAKEKIKWEQKGWPWKQENVERNFAEMDVNRDGIASGKERNAWYAKKAQK